MYTFVEIHSHTGLDLINVLLKFFKTNGIYIKNCRGQIYDNASNMSGRYNGMQAIIQNHNPLAMWIPCAAHSLNLVGQYSVESSTTVSYFAFIQILYTFFSKPKILNVLSLLS